jgi:hypothetical protein
VSTINERSRQVLAVGTATLGAVALGVSELVIWSGRPGGDAYDSDVLRYYTEHEGRIQAGALLSTAGVIALVAAVATIRPWFDRGPGRVLLVGMATCGAFLISAALVAWFLSSGAGQGAIDAAGAFDKWEWERALADVASILFSVPLIGAAVGLDRERRFGVTMTTGGIVLAASLVVPLAPWNFLLAIVWVVAALAFTVHGKRPHMDISRPEFIHRPAVAA